MTHDPPRRRRVYNVLTSDEEDAAPVKSRIVKIGNSRGIRIPKALLKQTGLGEEVELEVDGRRLIVRPAVEPREGWEESFAAMAEASDDTLLDDEPSTPTSWDEQEWEW